MKTLLQFLLVSMLITHILNAQTDFREGYIIRNEGDTLYGEIDYRGYLKMSKVCKFKDTNNTIYKYSPTDIKAFRFINSKYFVSKTINEKDIFLEYLINGKVSIYHVGDKSGDYYYIGKEGIGLTELPYEKGIVYRDRKPIFRESTRHIGILRYYLYDAPELQERINTFKDPRHPNLIKLAKDYHNAVCEEGEICIIYAKQDPLFKVNIEVLSGVVSFPLNREFQNQYHFQNGIIANIWLPRTNEKLYFRTGILFASPKEGEITRTYRKIPLHVGYILPDTYLIRPFLSIGFLSPSYSGGVQIQTGKRLNFGVQGWANFDFTRSLLIPYQITNYSILASAYIKI